ncbi:MAG: ABC transporter substrate-binding protein [Pseudomonadota bacterium]
MTTVRVGFIPLVDAAPLIVAHEMGFAGEEGISLELVKAPSWSTIRDMLAFGGIDAAHMLAPVPVAISLGIGANAADLSALMVLSVNGNVIGVSAELEHRLADLGHEFGFDNAIVAGQDFAKAAATKPLKIGVPFPISMHAELLYYWLSASGLPAPQGVDVRTVPPPLMADAIADGEIDAFCVGEPWGSKTVERGIGALLLPGSAIWSFAPEKVLAARTQWAEQEPDLTGRLMRAVWKASRWLGTEGTHTTTAELLSRSDYLNLPSEIIDRALMGRIVVRPTGETRFSPSFVQFSDGAATFPWRSQAAWIGNQLAARLGMDRGAAMASAKSVFRSDLYRTHLKDTGAIMPGASEKLEGGIEGGFAGASESGRLLLSENRFFDGAVFDPATKK